MGPCFYFNNLAAFAGGRINNNSCIAGRVWHKIFSIAANLLKFGFPAGFHKVTAK
jgi:hypothetical protein